MLSKTCEYAVRALLYIALNASKDKKIGIKQLSKDLDIPSHFIGKILQSLVRHNILSSVKGPNGGFYMTPENLKTPLLRIVEVIDGLDAFYKCGLGLKQCSDQNPCPIHYDFQPYRDQLKRTFEEKTVGSLAEEITDKPGNVRIA